MGVIKSAVAELKRLPLPGLGGSAGARYSFAWGTEGVPGERSYGELVGDGSGSSLFEACIGLIAASYSEAPLALWNVNPADGMRQLLPRHPMLSVLRRPTWDPSLRRTYYASSTLWTGVLCSWWIDGNGYVVKVRNALGIPVQRWYMPHWMLEPRWPDDGSAFISHYEYTPDGRDPVKIAVADVEHYRYGIDSQNMRKGYSPIKKVLREIYTDEEAARFSASILRNVGVPGLVVSPEAVAGRPIRGMEQNEALAVKAKFDAKVGGDNRGETIVMTGPTKIQTFGFSPEEMNLSSIRNVPEERIAAIMRVPAAVVGFGAGLEGVKVGATMREMREQLWESNILPTMRYFAEELAGQLLPDFASDEELKTLELGFDLRAVGALQELELKKSERWARLLSSGMVRRKEARSAIGMQWDDAVDDVYLAQPGVAAVAAPAAEADPEPVPAPADEETRAALRAGAEELAKMRQEVMAVATKNGDGRAEMLRFIQSGEQAAAARDVVLMKGMLELAAALRSQPQQEQIVKLSDEVERDEQNRMLRIRPIYGVVESNGNGKVMHGAKS